MNNNKVHKMEYTLINQLLFRSYLFDRSGRPNQKVVIQKVFLIACENKRAVWCRGQNNNISYLGTMLFLFSGLIQVTSNIFSLYPYCQQCERNRKPLFMVTPAYILGFSPNQLESRTMHRTTFVARDLELWWFSRTGSDSFLFTMLTPACGWSSAKPNRVRGKIVPHKKAVILLFHKMEWIWGYKKKK